MTYEAADLQDVVASESVRKELRSILDEYFARVAAHLAREYTNASEQAHRDEQTINVKGDLDEKRKSKSAMQKTYVATLTSHVETLATILGLEMPELKEFEDEENTIDLSQFGLESTGFKDTSGKFLNLKTIKF